MSDGGASIQFECPNGCHVPLAVRVGEADQDECDNCGAELVEEEGAMTIDDKLWGRRELVEFALIPVFLAMFSAIVELIVRGDPAFGAVVGAAMGVGVVIFLVCIDVFLNHIDGLVRWLW